MKRENGIGPALSISARMAGRSVASAIDVMSALPGGDGRGPQRRGPPGGAGALLEETLDLHDPLDQGLGPGRTAGDVDVHRDDLVDPLGDGVGPEHAAGR